MDSFMENQHRKITGYRELDQTEIDLMNKVKAMGAQFESVLLEVQAHIARQQESVWEGVDRTRVLLSHPPIHPKPSNPELADRLKDATPERFAAMSKTEIQTGLMYLTRAIAQPTSF